ncbi:uncharacterized protein BX664DRAFT_331635 [Halteromyces radiatus]|uniref:uncharacterized protein n=1 Tax=Halteromyces radiatus TaxID=101107 RepID=UPI00221F93C1|nr:uncharacterized protein BX664DRAFT_331635 [Halteromyces radiatus]KAI8088875.1 hypothetical protein BX664DRAFT_331635 [Halteromyces radiatus]
MTFPLVFFSKQKRQKKRHSVFSHHTVDQSDVLSKPFLPLDTRITSPTDLIDLVGHPQMTKPTPSRPFQQTKPSVVRLGSFPPSFKGSYTMHYTNGSSATPQQAPNRTVIDKTLMDMPPSPPPKQPTYKSRLHYSETLYNVEEKVRQSLPPKRDRRQSSPSILQDASTKQHGDQNELDRLRNLYDQERKLWQQKLEDYQEREQELMNLLETTRSKLDQLALHENHHHRTIHHHHHYHHYLQNNNNNNNNNTHPRRRRATIATTGRKRDKYEPQPDSMNFQQDEDSSIYWTPFWPTPPIV